MIYPLGFFNSLFIGRNSPAKGIPTSMTKMFHWVSLAPHTIYDRIDCVERIMSNRLSPKQHTSEPARPQSKQAPPSPSPPREGFFH